MTGAGLMIVKPKELIKALERMGFVVLRRSKGSHVQFQHIEIEPAKLRKWMKG